MKLKTITNFSFYLALIFVMTISLTACKGPAGADGLQGPLGPEGPVGPAGENGSVMHAGQGEPESGIGNPGDYYLDTLNSLLYGPKTEDNTWGIPIDLKGADGQDGTDGSQIYSGNTAPDVSLGGIGDYYLNTETFDLYGPKSESGWGTPINLQGNANVTLYIFDGHDFSESGSITKNITDLTETEFKESSWLFYLVLTTSSQGDILFQIPGYGDLFQTFYNPVIRYRDYDTDTSTDDIIQTFIAIADSGPGENYNEIRIIRTATSNVVDNTSAPKYASQKGYQPDKSNYEEVAKYYGLNQNNTYIISKP